MALRQFVPEVVARHIRGAGPRLPKGSPGLEALRTTLITAASRTRRVCVPSSVNSTRSTVWCRNSGVRDAVWVFGSFGRLSRGLLGAWGKRP